MNYGVVFTKQEIEYVLTVLASRPYSECASLIEKIQGQIAQAHKAAKEQETEALKKSLAEEKS